MTHSLTVPQTEYWEAIGVNKIVNESLSQKSNINNSNSPADIDKQDLASSSVQNLVNHNQDLSARLHVSLKKNIELEKTIHRFKKAYSQYEERLQSAKDQIAIYREKDRHSVSQIKAFNDKLTRLKAHLEYERKESEEKIDKLKEELSPMRSTFTDYMKLKKRVQNEYLPERDLLTQKLKEEKENFETLEKEKKNILKKLAEATMHIQAMAKDFKHQQAKAKTDYSLQIKELRLKLEDVQNENIVLSDRNRTLRREQIDRTELLNRLEELKKEKELSFKTSQEEREDLLLQMSNLKTANSRLKIENHDIKKQWAKTQADFRNFRNSNQSAEEEAQSLRALWEEKTKKAKNFEKMNESLSSQINGMESKLNITSTMHEETKQRLKFLFNQMNNIRDKQNERDKKATEALERAFKKAVEPFIDFDYHL